MTVGRLRGSYRSTVQLQRAVEKVNCKASTLSCTVDCRSAANFLNCCAFARLLRFFSTVVSLDCSEFSCRSPLQSLWRAQRAALALAKFPFRVCPYTWYIMCWDVGTDNFYSTRWLHDYYDERTGVFLRSEGGAQNSQNSTVACVGT